MSGAVDTDQHVEDLAEVWLDLPALGEFLEISNSETQGISTFGHDIWHPDQRRFEIERTGYDIVLKARQVGFSQLELARDVQFARTHEGSRVLIVVHDREEKGAFFGRLKMMVEGLARAGMVPPPSDATHYTKTEIVWPDTRSSIYITEAGVSESAAQKTGRSGTVHRLHATEAAFWGSPEEAWSSLKGATRLGSEIVIETTANGADTWFHDVWLSAREGRFGRFTAHFFPWWERADFVLDPALVPDPPRTRREKLWEERLVDDIGVTPEQLAWWRASVQTEKLDKTLREYPPTEDAAFQSSGATWIEPEYLDALGRRTREPIRLHKLKRGELRIFEEPIRGESYIAAGDVSDGVGLDEAAIVVSHHRTGRVVAAWDDRWTKPVPFARSLAQVGALYNRALLAPERDGMRTQGREPIGLVVLKALLGDIGYPKHRVYRDRETKKHGWRTDKVTRPIMLGFIVDAIEKAGAPKPSAAEVALGSTPDRRTVAEARAMVVDRSGKIRARGKHSSGGDDGLFFAWAIGAQVRERARIPGRGGRIAMVGTLTSADFRT